MCSLCHLSCPHVVMQPSADAADVSVGWNSHASPLSTPTRAVIVYNAHLMSSSSPNHHVAARRAIRTGGQLLRRHAAAAGRRQGKRFYQLSSCVCFPCPKRPLMHPVKVLLLACQVRRQPYSSCCCLPCPDEGTAAGGCGEHAERLRGAGRNGRCGSFRQEGRSPEQDPGVGTQVCACPAWTYLLFCVRLRYVETMLRRESSLAPARVMSCVPYPETIIWTSPYHA